MEEEDEGDEEKGFMVHGGVLLKMIFIFLACDIDTTILPTVHLHV